MKWFSNLKIARKLTIAFALVLVMTVGLGVFAITQFANLNESTYVIVDNRIPKINMMADASKDAVLLRRYELGAIAGDTPEVKEAYIASGAATEARFKDSLSKFEAKFTIPEGHRLFMNVEAKLQTYLADRNRALELYKSGNTKEALRVCFHENKAAFDALDAAIIESVKFNNTVAVEEANVAENTYHSSRNLVFTVLGFAVV